MPTVTTRYAHNADAPQLVEWLHANREKNKYDPDIFSYDSTRVLAVDVDGETVMYVPFQLVLMSDSLAVKPGLSKAKTALGLKAVIHELIRKAKSSRIGEIHFQGSDSETVEFAKRHGYEEMTGFVPMRLKPKNVTPPLPEDKDAQDNLEVPGHIPQ